MSDLQRPPEASRRRRFWTKRRIGAVLITIGIVPAFVAGIYNTVDYYLSRPEGTGDPEAARLGLVRTWDVAKYFWPLVPIGLVVHLLGVMEEAPKKKRW